MSDESKYIQEMQAGIRNAFDLMASRYPEVEIYTISIWTDDGARKSAISFDTYENSIAKCHVANERRQAVRRQFIASGIMAKVPHDMERNNNPDFKFQKMTENRQQIFRCARSVGRCSLGDFGTFDGYV